METLLDTQAHAQTENLPDRCSYSSFQRLAFDLQFNQQNNCTYVMVDCKSSHKQ